MSFRLVSILSPLVLLLLVPVVARSQASELPVTTEAELLSSLVSLKTGDEKVAVALLRDHKEFVTSGLCNSLLQAVTVSSALGNSARSVFLCEVAKATAIQLQDKTLLGRVLYKIGRAHFEQDNIKLAIEAYLQSKAILEKAGSRRDLVYVLSELGTLHIYAADYFKAEEYSQESLGLAESLTNSKDAPTGLRLLGRTSDR